MNTTNCNIHIILVLLLVFLIGNSCDNFEEINSDPDKTTQVNSSMLATNIILRTTRFSGRDSKGFIAENALSKYVGYANEGQMSQQYNLIGSSSFDEMTILPNIERMLYYAEGSIMEDSYKGLASFAKALSFYKMTMEMGDIPYSNAGKGENGVYRVKYDTQEVVLESILNEFKLANDYFEIGKVFDGDPTPYKGDPIKWQRAVNGFALKVLMTISNKEKVGSINIKERFASIVESNKLLEPTTGYLGLEYTTINKHPLSGTNDLFTSRTVISSLLVDNLKLYNDNRLFYFAEPAGKQIYNGKIESDFDAYVGVDVSIEYASMNNGHNNNEYSLLNVRYLKEDASEPNRILTFAEQQLILAEAVVRGWINGDAKEYYESGVKAALEDVKKTKDIYAHDMVITQEYINQYFTGEANFKTEKENQLKQIWMQRYFINFMQNAQSSYFEYRRNKFPEFPINPSTSLNENGKSLIPMRWTYPSSETNYNRENLIDALDRQYDGYDEINKIMWILK